MTHRDPILTVLFVISLVGLAASCAVHVATFFGFAPDLRYSRLLELHLVGFLLILAGLIVGWNVARTVQPRRFIARAFGYAPGSFRMAACLLVGYASIALFASLVMLVSGPASYLWGHGPIREDLRAVEFQDEQVLTVRMFSSAWIIGYAVAATLLSSARNAPVDDKRPNLL